MDSRFQVRLLVSTPNPQRLIYAAMHQDYSEQFIADEDLPDEPEAGRIIVKRLLAGGRGHFGPLEHPQISFAVGGYPHSVMQQARTHRVGVSFDCQSMRYTGARICAAARGEVDIEEVFYLRPPGRYSDRKGQKYGYTEVDRDFHRRRLLDAAEQYRIEVEECGVAEEQARGLLPFDFRQHFVVSFNLRSALHFMDLRSKADAQLEIQDLCHRLWPHLSNWAPAITEWYERNRFGKAQLAP